MCLAHAQRHATLAFTIKQELQQFEAWHERFTARVEFAPHRAACHASEFYRQAERILILLTWELHRKPVRGLNWPQRLLREAAQEIAGVRPAVITAETQIALRRFLTLRNRSRNIYGYDPHPRCLVWLMDETRTLYPRFMREVLLCREAARIV